MYDEMKFLFSVTPYIKNQNNDSKNNQVADTNNPVQTVKYVTEYNETDKRLELNKYIVNKNEIKNYIKNEVNRPYSTDSHNNPYLDYLEFSNNSSKAIKMKSADFAYLRDIGVMPINRLMILRRFSEGTVVPVDLSTYNSEPISVVVGWVKKDSPLLDFSFSEKWQRQGSGDMLHLMLAKIIKDEFGLDITSIIPIPGWGLGFMFEILNKMGLTDWNSSKLPIGNPNLLKESITRPHEEYGLESKFTFELETCYEQKYIGGVDPTVSTYDILNNLLRMGTSNTEFLGRKGSSILNQLRTANEGNTVIEWSSLIGQVVNSFISAIKESLTDLTETVNKGLTKSFSITDNSTPTPATNTSYGTNKGEQTQEKTKTLQEKATDKINETTSMFDLITNVSNKLMQTILNSTIARYQWPLRGSISMLTGDATTPWHLTIGNPYAPILSMNNVYVQNVSVTFGKEMDFNDLPKTMDVKISMEQGRSLGKQEIYELFGVRYKRYYNKSRSKNTAETTDEANQKMNSK